MQYYRCKCGKERVHTTMGVPGCLVSGCCKTTFAQTPEGHFPATPHVWRVLYDQHTGKPYEMCGACNQTKAEVA